MACTKLFDAGSGQANFQGEGGAKPNYQRYITQSDVGDGFFGMPRTEQGCQKQIKPSYWWVHLYHPIELCTLTLGQVASENYIH